MIEPLLAPTTPVFELDGQVVGELARDILQLDVREDTAGLKTLEARFLAYGPRQGVGEEELLYLDGRVFDFGKQIDISLGPPDEARIVFRGAISGLEVGLSEAEEPEVVVYAEDRLMDLRMTRRMRSYEGVSDAEIAERIAGEHGLTAEVDAEGPTYDVVQQWNMSDLAFLRERARLLRAEVWVREDTLYFQGRDARAGTELVLVRGNHILALRACADLAHQRTAVHVSGYSAADRALLDEEAGGEAVQAEISGGRTGPEILGQAFGERISYRVREVPLNETEAADWARAEMLRRCRGFVQVEGTTRGSPQLEVGSRLTLERVGGPFEGHGYYVTGVRHSFNLLDGYRTHFTAERATVTERS